MQLHQTADRSQQTELPKAMEQVGGWVKDRLPTRHKGRKARFWRKANVPGVETPDEEEL
ncbi:MULTISPECIES: hypothetical protein [Prochlorococcus]|uniref:hypothetical protein n=1 Tax=Prochlorococcus TaxID=1218 RepID=UPI001F294C4F|nr:hypothetical protein [Prochlorococcus marinus]